MADLENLEVNDTGFIQIQGGPSTGRPSNPSVGDIWYSTSYNTIEIFTGENWINYKKPVGSGGDVKNAFGDLDQINGLYSGVQTLSTDVYNNFTEEETFEVDVDFSNSNAAKYITRTNDGTESNNSGVNGECYSLDGVINGCDEGTDYRFNMYGAMRACILAGGRLCTLNEMQAGAAEGTGCGHDANAIWTSTPSGNDDGRFYIVVGDVPRYGNILATALPDDMDEVASQISDFPDPRIGIRCCHPISGKDSWDLRN